MLRNLTLLSLLLFTTLLAAPAAAGEADRVAIGHDVTVAEGEDLAGDVVVIGANAHVNGKVRGDVVVIGGTLHLGPNARIDGDAVHLIGELDQAASASVIGSTVGVDGAMPAPDELAGKFDVNAGAKKTGFGAGSTALRVGRLVGWAASSACLVVLGLLFLSTWPERSRNLRRTVEAAPGASLLVGGLVTAGIALMLVLLGLTIVGFLGWPLIILATMGVWLAGVTGVCEALGDRLPLPDAWRGRAASFVVGALVFSLFGILWMIGGPSTLLAIAGVLFVGALALGAALLSGLGGQPFGA